MSPLRLVSYWRPLGHSSPGRGLSRAGDEQASAHDRPASYPREHLESDS